MSKINASAVELRYALEDSFKTVSGNEIWNLMEPNSFADYGPTYKKVARPGLTVSCERERPSVSILPAA